MGVMALALSVVGGAIGAGLGVGALSGMWGIPAVVAVATVGVVTVGVVGGGAGGGRGSVAACSAPADSACAPAAAGVPVVIPVVNDWPNDCGDNGAVAAAGGMPAAGTDGPPTPTAGALGGRGGETVPGGGGPGGMGAVPNGDVGVGAVGGPLLVEDELSTMGAVPNGDVGVGAVGWGDPAAGEVGDQQGGLAVVA
ncbi:hypothetical protein [Mycobacterium tuberculosis]|uniref:hypothetical protein n=1 Tax=Mycobacterium tuberculosis TaxID=1773 RepID=UPI003F4A9983